MAVIPKSQLDKNVDVKPAVHFRGVEDTSDSQPLAKTQSLQDLAMTSVPLTRISTGMPEFDKVLGGGLVRGQALLFAGPRGIGITSFFLQLANRLAMRGMKVLFASGDQTESDLAEYARRLHTASEGVQVLALQVGEQDQKDIEAVVEEAKHGDVLFVDSLQTSIFEDVGGDVGSEEQVRAVSNYLTSFAKIANNIVLVRTHIDRDDQIEPSAAHLFDTIVRFDFECEEISDENGILVRQRTENTNRVVVTLDKNRYGSSSLMTMFEMTSEGLK